jgi:hypothetical protein
MKLIARSGNKAVIKFEDRSFPGIFIQGDSFYEIYKTLKLIATNNKEVEEVCHKMEDIISFYEDNIDNCEKGLPYTRIPK